jgi:hypothetical protein
MRKVQFNISKSHESGGKLTPFIGRGILEGIARGFCGGCKHVMGAEMLFSYPQLPARPERPKGALRWPTGWCRASACATIWNSRCSALGLTSWPSRSGAGLEALGSAGVRWGSADNCVMDHVPWENCIGTQCELIPSKARYLLHVRKFWAGYSTY